MGLVFISHTDNKLFVSTNIKNEFVESATDLPSGIIENSEIINFEGFFEAIKFGLQEIFNNNSIKNHTFIYLINPSKTYYKFITLSKNSFDDGNLLSETIKEKVGDINLESYYFGYDKIAPFVHQFVAVNKSSLDNILNFFTKYGMNLKAVIPWELVLTKNLEFNDPCVFLINYNNENFILLSELNGLYLHERLENIQDTESVNNLIQNLSIYKRQKPITKVYKVGDVNVSLSDGYTVTDYFNDSYSYSFNKLVSEYISKDLNFHEELINLLNLLPLPATKKNSNLLAVKIVSTAVVVAGLLVFGVYNFVDFNKLIINTNKNSNTQLATNNDVQTPQVLSETSENKEEKQEVKEEPVKEEKVELKKSDLSIRVENGAGIAGIAGRTQAFLQDKGYKVVSIGNSNNQDQSITTIKFANQKKDFENLLKTDLSELYNNITVEYDLPENLDYDVLITVGRE